MTPDVSHAVQLLLEARRSGTQIAPPFALPDRSAVYAIQDGVAAATGPVAGWKVGARTSTAEPAGAPLFAGTLTPSPARFDGTAMHMIGIEVEISFHIVRDIAARTAPVERDEALAAVGDAFVGMEVVDTRIADFQKADPEWLLADNQMNHALVVGDPVKNWKALDWPALQVRPRGRRSAAAARLDDRPCRADAWRVARRPGDHHRLMDRAALLPAGHTRSRIVRRIGRSRSELLTVRDNR